MRERKSLSFWALSRKHSFVHNLQIPARSNPALSGCKSSSGNYRFVECVLCVLLWRVKSRQLPSIRIDLS